MLLNLIHRIEQLTLTVWVGCLLAIGYIAVPILFHAQDNRQLAGALAGQMFNVVHYIGLACGVLLMVLAFYIDRKQYLRQWRHYLIVSMLVLILISLFLLQPPMAEIKAHVGWQDVVELKAQFGQLHGISSVLYLLTSAMGVLLVLLGLRQR